MIHINIGSNLESIHGSKMDNISIAINLLQEAKVRIIEISNFYETPSYPNTNFPKFINIGLFGRVNTPGTLKINKTATLNEAVALAGGTKFLKGPVNFIRYNSDGTIDRRKFKFKFSARRGDFKNPYLRDGDVIYVGKSSLNIANEVITEVTSPLQGIVSAFGFYKIIAD